MNLDNVSESICRQITACTDKSSSSSLQDDDKPELNQSNLSNSNTWKCKVCNKEFVKKSRLDMHFRCHSGEKPYKCSYPQCGREFSRSDHLTRHHRSHSGEKPYACSFSGCDQKFITRYHLTRHEAIHIKNVTKFNCIQCAENFSLKTSLRSHLASAHGIYEFKCSYDSCERYFASKWKLERHMNRHLLERYVCKEIDCSGSFTTRVDYSNHLLSVHNKILEYKPKKRISSEGFIGQTLSDDYDSDNSSESSENHSMIQNSEVSKKRALESNTEVSVIDNQKGINVNC